MCIDLSLLNFLDFLAFFITSEITKNVVSFIFGGITLYVALNGLNAWKKQLKGSDEYKLAKDILRCLLIYKENFDYLRNESLGTHEFISFREFLDKKDEKKYFIYLERRENLRKSWFDLKISFIEGNIIRNNNLNQLIKKLEDKNDILLGATKIYLSYLSLYSDDEKIKESHLKFIDKSIIWSSSKDDEFNKEVESIVEEFEKELKNILNRK